MAKFLEARKDELNLANSHVLELGSGACSVSGLMAALLCKEVDLTDRLEVLEELDQSINFAFQAVHPRPKVTAKVLDWKDLEFTETAFKPGKADIILMSDVVYFPMLRRPLLHTLLFLCNENTKVLWANCDRYPSFEPDMARFLEVYGDFFEMTVEEERDQVGCGGPSEVIGGKVTIRSMKISNAENAAQELAVGREGGRANQCIQRCFK